MNTKLSQLLGIMRYEIQLQWQRRSLTIVGVIFMAITATILFISREGIREGELNRATVTFGLIFSTAPLAFLLMVLAIPPVVAETIAKDNQFGVDELRDSLPITPGLYLLGKLLAIWLCVILMMFVIAFTTWLTYLIVVGPVDLSAYLQVWLVGAMPAGLFVSALSVLLASRQPNRKRATMIGGAITIYSLISFPLGFSTEYSVGQTLLPSAWFSLIMERVMDYAAAAAELPGELIFMADVPDWFRWQTVLATAVQLLLVWLVVWGWWRYREQ
jgi:ABC-type transport system involved in multi-copper enzyme maturation permease subunit